MKRSIILFTLTLVVILSLILAACAAKTTSTTTQPPVPTQSTTTTTSVPPPPPKANWWDKFGTPQYGGTLAVRNAMLGGGSFDPSAGMMGAGGMATNTWLQGLAFLDWTLDRNTWAYPCGFTPMQYIKGLLIESWTQKDPTTIELKVRPEAKWQNKAPVNGRNVTADDIKFNLDRFRTSPMSASGYTTIASVTAVDKLTVDVKLKAPSVLGLYQLLTASSGYVPPEWVALGGTSTAAPPAGGAPGGAPPAGGGPPAGGPPGPGGPGGAVAGGPLTDWKNVVGSGPFILTDFVAGTSLTLSKNPDYWQTDERYPKNKIPYIDTLKQVGIPDSATALAALRTGQIDMWTDMMGALSMQQGDTLSKSNPEIQLFNLPRPAAVVMPRVDKAPFNDIRVRKAMQLSIDRQSIAKNYYFGSKYSIPVGIVSPILEGFAIPYAQWPADLKDEYSFNVNKAKSLMTEAGYPTGFKTHAVASSDQDMQLLQLIKSEFMEIGIDVEIQPMDRNTYQNFLSAGKQDALVYSDGMAGLVWSPVNTLMRHVSTFAPQSNNTYSNDPNYDKMWADWNAATTDADFKKISADMDQYSLRQHWNITILPSATPVAAQAYVKGYSGEIMVDPSWAGAIRSRIWIDQSLKK